MLAQDATPVTTSPVGEEQAHDGLSVDVIELFDALPGTIRGDLSLSNRENLVHGSDGPESAEREIALWFPDL